MDDPRTIGTCTGCRQPGPIGAPCRNPRCGERGHHIVPSAPRAAASDIDAGGGATRLFSPDELARAATTRAPPSPSRRRRGHAPVDEEMVVTSASLWSERAEGPIARGATPPEARARSSKGRRVAFWAMMFTGVAGLGAGLAFLVGGSRGEPAQRAQALAPRTPPEPSAQPAPPTPRVTVDTPRSRPLTPVVMRGAMAVATAAPARVALVTPERAAPAKPVPEAPPAWVAAALAANPWVEVAPASQPTVLGVSEADTRRPIASRLTGFRPERRVLAPSNVYSLQAHEVTWGELELAVTLDGVATLKRPPWVPRRPAARAALPATGVPWGLARSFCKSLGGDLPSEPEWEWAARGPELRQFPWGDAALDARTVHFLVRGSVPVVAVGSSRQDRVPGEPGLDDLLANAQEWTRDVWTAGSPDATADPSARAVRGWPLRRPGNAIPAEGATYRQGLCVADVCRSTADISRVGFRCALHGANTPR